MDLADIRGQQTLADAQSANAAAHDIHLATAIWYTDNAIAWNDYVDVVVPLEANYYSAVQTAWVDFATARNNAHATKEIAVADAKAAAFRRWATDAAGGYFGIYVGYLADMEEAAAARTQTYELAQASYLNAMVAADALWVETVLPAWVTYEDEVSDHAVTNVNDSSPAWETAENDIADAALAYTTAAVPVGTQLTVDLNGNYSAWVNDVALADEEYWNTRADNDVTWVEDASAAEESYENSITTHATTYAQAKASLNVLLDSTFSEANTNAAGSVAGLITGTPFTPLSSTVSWPLSPTTGGGANWGGVASASSSWELARTTIGDAFTVGAGAGVGALAGWLWSGAQQGWDGLWAVGPVDAYSAANGEDATAAREFAKRYAEASGEKDATRRSWIVNGARHALWQARLTFRHGRSAAKEIGDSHESHAPGSPLDNWIDSYNNKNARDIAEEAYNSNAITIDQLEHLIHRRLDEGRFILTTTDPRIPANLREAR